MRAGLTSIVILALSWTLTSMTVGDDHGTRLPPAAEMQVDFHRDVLPILASHCFECHQGADASSGVRLDFRAKLLGQTDGVAYVTLGHSDQSRLIHLVAGLADSERMPPIDEGDPLSPQQIGVLRAWIDQGVRWDEDALPPPHVAAHDHWAFQPIQRPPVPAVMRPAWPRNAIDHFILARHEAQGLTPSPSADRHTLIRRLSLNLLGLPPTPGEVQRFIDDRSVDAYAQLVERLLASPHYGERWGRHWQDVARFAESQGFVENHEWPHFWRYRDWVVNSFNEDLPYGEFVTQQIAGDELQPYRDENVVATGFLAAARLAGEELSCVRQENDMYVDIVNTTSAAFLGLTMACAQCHDHKFDPITQRDYYRLQAFFVSGYPGNLVLSGSQLPAPFHETAAQLQRHTLAIRERILQAAYAEVDQQDVRAIMQKPADERTPADEETYRLTRARLNIRLAGCNGYRISEEEKQRTADLKAELEPYLPDVRQTWGFYSPVTSPHRISVLPMASNFPLVHDADQLSRRRGYLLRRGDPYSTAIVVTPGWPAVLQGAFGESSSMGTNDDSLAAGETQRSELARWLISPQHPLTARVWVNRIWQYHFGRGLVTTPDNLGTRGADPTHPQLLDYLACELIDSGWSTKHIQRLIVSSNTYQQSAASNEVAARIDPANELLWRWPIRRLESEALRDTALKVSGELDASFGGPSVPLGQASRRRSMYHFQKRDVPSHAQSLFDAPTAMSASCGRRYVSTTTLQSLFLLNSPQAEEFAKAFARRIRRRYGDDRAACVAAAFQEALGRQPSEYELAASLDYLSADHDGGPTVTSDHSIANDEPIERWQDRLAGDNQLTDTATQTIGTRQPRYRDAAHGINGRPAIHFSGKSVGQADHVLEIAESPEVELENSYSLFVTLRFLGSGLGNQVILLKGRRGDLDIGTFGLMRYSGGDVNGHLGIDQNIDGTWSRRLLSSQPVPDEVPLLVVANWDGTTVSLEIRTAEGILCRDKAPLAGQIDTQGAGRLGIGGYLDAFSSNGERLNGDLGEVVIYRQSLSATELQAMTSYLSDKWLSTASTTPRPDLPVTRSLGLHLDAASGIGTRETLSPLSRFCQALMNLNEFVYVP